MHCACTLILKGDFMKKLHKICAVILALVVLSSVVCMSYSAATIFKQDGFLYAYTASTKADLYGRETNDPGLVIPKEFNDHYITNIVDSAFMGDENIQTLSFSKALLLERIGYYAFENCANLSGTVYFTGRINEIGTSAFQGCSSLESVIYRNNLITVISDQCFYNCTSLSYVELPNSLTKIEKFAFANTALTEITIPKSVSSIDSTAFDGCNDLVIYCYTDSAAHQFAEENDIEYVLLDAPAKEYFVGKSLSLDGDIGVNFYLDLTADEAKSAVVNFSWNVNNEVKTSSFDLSNAKKLTAGYKATCRIAPAEMTGSILAVLMINGEKVSEERYSAKQYADVILSDSYQAAYKGTGARSYENLKNLILNMLSFGSRAQTAFAVNLDTLADKGSGYTPEPVSAEDISVANANMTEGLDNYGLSYVGSTLVCLTETTIRHYYKVTDQNKFDAVSNNIFIEGKPASAVEKNGSIYFEINNIPAADLDRYYTLKIGNNEYQYSAFNYIKTALPSNKVEDNVKKLIQVLYRYNQAANAFFA